LRTSPSSPGMSFRCAGPDFWREVGFEKEPDIRQRLGAICAAYGASASHVVDALLAVQEEDIRRISELGARGIFRGVPSGNAETGAR